MKQEFNLETFKAWLDGQDDKRKFKYLDTHNCLFATAIKDITQDFFNCGCGAYYNGDRIRIQFPDWANKLDDFLVTRGYNKSIGEVKNWIKENNL